MTMLAKLSEFVQRASWDSISQTARDALKVRVLDSLACAIGALEGPPIRSIREVVHEFGGREFCTLIGGGRTAPDRAALFNGALVRYLDYNDSYLARGETCHPSDNLGAVLAAAEFAGASGKELLVALAVAYQVQCRLCDVAPVRHEGFDHTTQGSYAVAAGVSRALSLTPEQTANAIAIAGTALNALRVTRTGALSHWKGLAYPHTGFAATHAAFLARRGITGPAEVFEGNKGFMDAIAGHFDIDWLHEDLERVSRTAVKRYNAEVHSQSAIEALLELRSEHHIDPRDVERVEAAVFDVAYHIIGGGEEGDKTEIRTKEEADHSLPYMLAVALLDGNVQPEQYHPDRIVADDVQGLLRRVRIRPADRYTRRFPEHHACQVRVVMRDGTVFETEKEDYLGFPTRPADWPMARRKFERLATPFTGRRLADELLACVETLETRPVRELTELLNTVGSSIDD